MPRGLNPWRGEDIPTKLLRDYEILYIVRPEVEETDLPDVTKRVESLIESLQGVIQNTNVWGKRRLAYEVDHLKEGHYVLTDFQIEPVRVPEMEATLKISDQVFRHLIVRKPALKAGVVTEKAPPPPEIEAEATAEETTATAADDAAEPDGQPVADEGSSDGAEDQEEA